MQVVVRFVMRNHPSDCPDTRHFQTSHRLNKDRRHLFLFYIFYCHRIINDIAKTYGDVPANVSYFITCKLCYKNCLDEVSNLAGSGIFDLRPTDLFTANASKLIEKYFLDLRSMFSIEENIRIFFSKQEK